MTNWIEIEDGMMQLNAEKVVYFHIADNKIYARVNELDRPAVVRATPSGVDRGILVRSFDTEDEAKHGLQTLIESLVGVQHQAGVTVVTPGAAFPGRDTTRIVADGVKIADAGTWRRANGFS